MGNLWSEVLQLEAQLDPERFVKAHRHYIVNIDQIAKIEPGDSGEALLIMKDGNKMRCSRGYRYILRQRIT